LKEGSYMMARNIIGRILHVTYPAIVFAVVLLIWSSSNLAEVARFTPPPVSDGFNFFWNPPARDTSTCSVNPAPKIKFKQSCSSASNNSSLNQFKTN